MEIDEIEQLVDIIREARISELTVSSEGSTVRLRKPLPAAAEAPSVRSTTPERAPVPESDSRRLPDVESPAEAPPQSDLFITAPMVGIFHRIDGVGGVGAAVRTGQPVCAIESMKLMNDILSEHDAVIAEALVDDGVPVEYGQPLFRLESV